jgi:predicted O-linked N-acetylglucosamine transferase (SPINDLY family)
VAELVREGERHQQAARLAAAEMCYRRALELRPGDADTLCLLGGVLLARGATGDAVEAFRQAAAGNPDDPTLHSDLGVALHMAGRADEAIASYHRAIALKPDYGEAHSNLGNVLREKGRRAEAVAAYRQAVATKPGHAQAHANLGAALQEQGAFEEAIIACRRAISLLPNYAEAHCNLGNALLSLGRTREAAAALRRAVALDPAYAVAWSNLGNALRGDGRTGEAEAAYREAIRVRPGYASAYCNLGNVLQDGGRLDEAMAAYRQALALEPDFAAAYSNLLMCMSYATSVSLEEVLEEAHRFGGLHRGAGSEAPFPNVPAPSRRLRIGYVSADFRNHPVGYFLVRALQARDRATAEVFCYSAQLTDDDMTARLRDGADHWRSIAIMTDAEAAAMIRADGIDILVDLAGHTAGNRLMLFARRPAPIQASWLGYFGTTGLDAMDHVLADRFVVPPGEERYFTETVLRLPDSYLCYDPPALDIQPGPPPALESGAIIFGCFNNRAKITPEAVHAWAQVLQRVPGSCLFLKTRTLADATLAGALADAFAAQGVTRERLTMEGHSPIAEMMAAYRRIDIVLDPFPFVGGTTSAEALWMGVPVVTLRGNRWAGRIGESILSTAGLGELVADDVDDYVRKAAALAADLPRLARLHAELRSRLETSPFCDGAQFARSLDAAYRSMWRDWCVRAARVETA